MPAPLYEHHRTHIAAIRQAALSAVDPARAVYRWLHPEDWANANRVFLVGAGKAGVPMATAAAALLGSKLTAGLIAVPAAPRADQAPSHLPNFPRLRFIEAGHPHPNEASLVAGQALADLLAHTEPGDLVVAVISGGGSALLELPQPGLGLNDLRAITDQLLRSGATIQEVNAVRARLSRLKAGGLARLAAPARVISLILSDVVGNHLPSIASGPTVLDPPDPGAALAVVERFRLRAHLPPAALELLSRPPEAPGPAPSVDNRLVATNRVAGEAAAGEALSLGFDARWMGDNLQGEAREAGRQFAALLTGPQGGRPQTRLATGRLPPLPGGEQQPHCFVLGGETTVTVRGQGLGGRNQEAALAAALALAGLPGVVVATIATDGVDGPTDAAGAIVTGETISRAGSLGLNAQQFLDDNNAYAFLAAAGALLRTGPTGTNVNDLWLGLVY